MSKSTITSFRPYGMDRPEPIRVGRVLFTACRYSARKGWTLGYSSDDHVTMQAITFNGQAYGPGSVWPWRLAR